MVEEFSFNQKENYMLRFMCMILGFALLLFGIIGLLTPIPFGFIFIIISLLFLIPTTPGFAAYVRRMRMKYVKFDQMMVAVIARAPMPYKRILQQTDIDELDRPMY